MSKKETDLERGDRRRIVAQNLVAGLSPTDIAKALGVDTKVVRNDMRQILTDWRVHYTQDIQMWVSLQLRRTDLLLNAIWKQALAGDIRAIETCLTIMNQQAKLMGLSPETLIQIAAAGESGDLYHERSVKIEITEVQSTRPDYRDERVNGKGITVEMAETPAPNLLIEGHILDQA